MALKSPERISCTGKAGLHFVGDKKPALGADQIDCGLQETRRVGVQTVARKDRVDNECCRLDPIGTHLRNRVGQIGCEFGALFGCRDT